MMMKWYGKDVLKKIDKAGHGALTDASEFLLDEGNKTVPHDEGTLEASGQATVSNDGKSATVSYDTPYAAKQHEDQTLNHQGKGRAKWLELTMKEKEKKVRVYVSDAYKKALK